MFGISMWELLLVALLLFIVVGPKKLPELARSLGKALGKFRESVDDLKKDVDIEEELRLLQQARNFSPRKLLEDEEVTRKGVENVEPPKGPKSKKPQREGRHQVSPGAKKPSKRPAKSSSKRAPAGSRTETAPQSAGEQSQAGGPKRPPAGADSTPGDRGGPSKQEAGAPSGEEAQANSKPDRDGPQRGPSGRILVKPGKSE
jgi:sec-independent protein translocase protein TatB